jgi:hypothetical protein
VIEGITRPWLVLNLTWQSLRERFGAETVTALTGRLGVTGNPDLEWEEHRTELTFSELLDQVLDPETGNDTYVTARCKLSEGPLKPLRADLTVPSQFLTEADGGTAFIVGPAGAETQLHFDISTTLLCQLVGRKRVWLVPPEEDVTSTQLYWADPVDLDDPSLAVREVVMEPGDALSIPAGWWHRTLAEEPCFTVTLSNVRQANNRHDWFVDR